MGRHGLQLKHRSKEEIQDLFVAHAELEVGVKLHAVRKVTEGMSSRKLTEFYSVTFKQICNWFHAFDNCGIEGLRVKKRTGKKSRLTEEQKHMIRELVIKHNPSEYGYKTGTWTGLLLIDWIKTHYKIEYKKAQIYNILKSLGLTYQKGKGIYPEQNQEAREDFKDALKKKL